MSYKLAKNATERPVGLTKACCTRTSPSLELEGQMAKEARTDPFLSLKSTLLHYPIMSHRKIGSTNVQKNCTYETTLWDFI
jgi:hypothetical protein